MWFVLILYLCSLVLLAGFGLHMFSIFLRAWWRPVGEDRRPLTSFPKVTVQIPVCNEGNLVEQTIHSVCGFDYPPDRLEIQVCDDSTDAATSAICRQLTLHYQRKGVAIHHIQRSPRTGFKPGNLNHAMRYAKGEFIAIFDADFQAPADFLTSNLPILLEDQQVALVQTHWTHRNADTSLFHQAIESSYEVHLLMEQQTWSLWDLWMHFNGSAGIWRREALHACGDWPEGSGVEDLYMSYLVQLQGWKIRFSQATTCTAKLPDTLAAFRTQQKRWALSCGEIMRSLCLPLMRSKARLASRQQAIVKLGSYLTYVGMAGVMWLTWPVVRWLHHHPEHMWIQGVSLGLFGALIVGNGLVHSEANRRMKRGFWASQKRAILVSLEQSGMAIMVGFQYLKGLCGGTLRHWQPSNVQTKKQTNWAERWLEWGALLSITLAVIDGIRWGIYGLPIPAIFLGAGVLFFQLLPLWETNTLPSPTDSHTETTKEPLPG